MNIPSLTEPNSHINQHQLHESNNQQVNKATLAHSLKPLTLPYHDKEGLYIQLWKSAKYGLIGSVVDCNGNQRIISGNKICNPLNPHASPKDLVGCLEKNDPRIWQLAFDITNLSITIWPHLEAAGKGEKVRDIRAQGSPVRYTDRGRFCISA